MLDTKRTMIKFIKSETCRKENKKVNEFAYPKVVDIVVSLREGEPERILPTVVRIKHNTKKTHINRFIDICCYGFYYTVRIRGTFIEEDGSETVETLKESRRYNTIRSAMVVAMLWSAKYDIVFDAPTIDE